MPHFGRCSYEIARTITDPVVAPAQVWDGLTTEAQAGAIQLMARLASNLVTPRIRLTTYGDRTMSSRLSPPRSDPSISTARP